MPTTLITGANRGIGLELTRRLTDAGHRVIGTARDPDSADDLRSIAWRTEPLNIFEPESIAELAHKLAGQSIDYLINNAAVAPEAALLTELDFSQVARTFEVNTFGPIRLVQSMLANLRNGNAKTVINLTSNLSSLAQNESGGYYAYRANKAALNMLTVTLARELGREGFTCVVVHPGWVRTRMGGDQAPLSVEESASGLSRVIQNLTPADNGSFLDWKGEAMPW